MTTPDADRTEALARAASRLAVEWVAAEAPGRPSIERFVTERRDNLLGDDPVTADELLAVRSTARAAVAHWGDGSFDRLAHLRDALARRAAARTALRLERR